MILEIVLDLLCGRGEKGLCHESKSIFSIKTQSRDMALLIASKGEITR